MIRITEKPALKMSPSTTKVVRQEKVGEIFETNNKFNSSVDASQLMPAFLGQLPVSAAKSTDLVKLCSKRAIPSKFHAFFNLVLRCLP
jgi:hypothetical protein